MNDCKLKKETVKRSEYPWRQTQFEHMITEPENYNEIFEILTCNEGTDTQADIKRGGICSTCVNAKLHKASTSKQDGLSKDIYLFFYLRKPDGASSQNVRRFSQD